MFVFIFFSAFALTRCQTEFVLVLSTVELQDVLVQIGKCHNFGFPMQRVDFGMDSWIAVDYPQIDSSLNLTITSKWSRLFSASYRAEKLSPNRLEPIGLRPNDFLFFFACPIDSTSIKKNKMDSTRYVFKLLFWPLVLCQRLSIFT